MKSVYGLIDPITHEVRYVGSSYNVKMRLYHHLRSKQGTPVGDWVQGLRDKGTKPEMVVFEYGLNTPKSAESELFWMAYLRGLGADLLNRRNQGGYFKTVGVTSRWIDHYGWNTAVLRYNDFVDNSQPF